MLYTRADLPVVVWASVFVDREAKTIITYGHSVLCERLHPACYSSEFCSSLKEQRRKCYNKTLAKCFQKDVAKTSLEAPPTYSSCYIVSYI